MDDWEVCSCRESLVSLQPCTLIGLLGSVGETMNNPFRVLHLSDFHWDEEKQEDQKVVVDRLLDDLAIVTKVQRPDIVVFSGDLVHRGQNARDFVEAKTRFLDRVRDATGTSDAECLICPGNHEVDRNSALSGNYVEAGLKSELQDTASLNRHVDRYFRAGISEDASNTRLSNYFEFVRKHYNQAPELVTNYVDCLIKQSSIGKIGVALFNSAWRSIGAGESERHQLLLAERVVDNAAEVLKSAAIKIAVVHHPLDWLSDWNAKSVRIPLFLTFDLVLFGHVHEAMPTLMENTVGECVFAQGGCLYEHRDYYNGYQLIDIHAEPDLRFDFHLRSWFNYPRRAFGPAENICAGGFKSFTPRFATGGPKRLSVGELLQMQEKTDDIANQHAKTLQVGHNLSFDEAFTCPPLSEKPEEALSSLKPAAYRANLLQLEDILKENGVIVFTGPRESGKSTIALKLSKEFLRAQGAPFKIPVHIDFSILKKYDSLDCLVRRHVSGLNMDLGADRILANHRCGFIVDNVSLADAERVVRLKKLIHDNKDKHDWYIFLDRADLVSRQAIVDEFKATRPPIYIQPFRRGEIRELVTKCSLPARGGVHNLDTIIKLIDDNDLPRTPYIVMLLVAVMSNMTLDSGINEAALLEKMVDLILNKQDPANIRSSTDFTGLNIVLEEIAEWLSVEDDYIKENDLLGRLAKYLTDRGIQAGAGDLLAHFVKVGLLDKIADDVCVRYRSFKSYFLARFAARNKEYVPRLLENSAILKHSKEFSLLCDLSRQDSDLLSFLEVVILELQPEEVEQARKSTFLETELKGSFAEIVDDRLEDISGGPQSSKQLDERFDFQDRAKRSLAASLKQMPTASKPEGMTEEEEKELMQNVLRLGAYMQAWSVWGRALTSLDFVQLNIRKPSFVRLLDHWARIAAVLSEAGDQVIEEIFEEAKKDKKEFSDKMKVHFEYSAHIHYPLETAQRVFSHIASSSVHQLLAETFDELDATAPEALAAACMLIRHRPADWERRVHRFIEARVQKGRNTLTKYFVLEALYQEYHYHLLDPEEVRALERLIAKLLSQSGLVTQQTRAILNKFEQNRPLVELITKDARR